jgi:hypothetical protein
MENWPLPIAGLKLTNTWPSCSPLPIKTLIAVQSPGGLALNPPPGACEKLSPRFTYVNGSSFTLRMLVGTSFASRAFLRSAKRASASDPGSARNLPCPVAIGKSMASVLLTLRAGPNSISNLASFPRDSYVASSLIDPFRPLSGLISKPTDPELGTYASATRSGRIGVGRLHPEIAKRGSARRHLTSFGVIRPKHYRTSAMDSNSSGMGKVLIVRAGSGGRRNTCAQFTSPSLKAQSDVAAVIIWKHRKCYEAAAAPNSR